VVLKVPSPVTGRLQGIEPTCDGINSLPLHAWLSSCPAVRKFRSAVNEGWNVFMTYVDVLFGRLVRMKSLNCCVSTLPVRLMATSERRTSPDVKKNVRSRASGPPNPHAVSLRLKSGCWKLGVCF
jgi:hypothetical protein